MIYAVFWRREDWELDQHHILIGVYTTRTLALEAAREAGEEWSIKELKLNYPDSGNCIWDSFIESQPKLHHVYQRWWPTGYPVPPSAQSGAH